MIVARRCIVRGRVQGVAFRWSTQECAHELGLSGYVRNLADGSVEVLAQGEQRKVDVLCEWLWQGPAHARVDTVECHEVSAEALSGFRVA